MYNSDRPKKLPELLCPAGDAVSLAAAIDAGADAVYLGSTDFNARKNATNFTPEAMREAIKLAHAYGVKVYITQNTLALDRELSAYLSAAESAIMAGIDALIVADTGGAVEIHRRFPEAELHASTQMSGHNTDAARRLAAMGFSRMVCAREMSLTDIRTFCKQSPIEAEVFVHGALCVCHSGQCLFSSVVGGRSGNRGECAQPCRLPYGGKKGNAYPLSLKDLALAEHIPALIDAGVASLKIEGRMKSPEYVREVTRIYRRLLDEGRSADASEMRRLAEVFSRGGFTDGYFRGRVDSTMLGTRSEADKKKTEQLEPFSGITRRVPMNMSARICRGQPICLSVSAGGKSGYAEGPEPFEARNAPLSREAVAKNLTKLGATVYEAGRVDIVLDEGVMLPISVLNALRRDAVADLEKETVRSVIREETALSIPKGTVATGKTARFCDPRSIPDEARRFFDRIYLPLECYDGSTDGVILPPVIFDSERARVEKMLAEVVAMGARHALVGNLGHLDSAVSHGLVPHGDFRLNVTNNASMAALEKMGFADAILSPELTLPQVRDIGGAKQVIVYGRLPLMILEKCVGRELGDCRSCAAGKTILRDRRGAEFPVLRAFDHRSVIYNSLVTGMSDMGDRLETAGIRGQHFIFSVENADECRRVIEAYREGAALGGAVRRLGRG